MLLNLKLTLTDCKWIQSLPPISSAVLPCSAIRPIRPATSRLLIIETIRKSSKSISFGCCVGLYLSKLCLTDANENLQLNVNTNFRRRRNYSYDRTTTYYYHLPLASFLIFRILFLFFCSNGTQYNLHLPRPWCLKCTCIVLISRD